MRESSKMHASLNLNASLLRYPCFSNMMLCLVIAFAAGSSAMAGSYQATAPTATAKSSKPAATPASRLGVVKEKPASGQFVKIEGGYMVPYKATLPGSDVEFEMVPIPGGTFTMGSPDDEDDRRDDEGPQFQVVVEPFWMGKYEVTWKEYKKFMDMDENYKKLDRRKVRKMLDKFDVDAVTAPSPLYKPTYTYASGVGPNQPAATMSQYAAKQYTKWLSKMAGDFYRLPTEAEWEYACRAGTTTAFYFGDDSDLLEDHAWLADNSEDERHDVGLKKPNPWGLYDMYGNVAEWVLDAYNEEGYPHVKAGDKVTVAEAFAKPTEVYGRVVRGGSFELEVEDCRSAARLGSEEEWKDEDPNYPQSPWWYTSMPGTGVGFRMIRPLTPPPTLAQRDNYWRADLVEIEEDARARMESNGKGSLGTADEKLGQEIRDINEKR